MEDKIKLADILKEEMISRQLLSDRLERLNIERTYVINGRQQKEISLEDYERYKKRYSRPKNKQTKKYVYEKSISVREFVEKHGIVPAYDVKKIYDYTNKTIFFEKVGAIYKRGKAKKYYVKDEKLLLFLFKHKDFREFCRDHDLSYLNTLRTIERTNLINDEKIFIKMSGRILLKDEEKLINFLENLEKTSEEND